MSRWGSAVNAPRSKTPNETPTFSIARQAAPDILLFANLGAVQLNYGYGIDQCRRAVDMIEADALILHLNPLQEAVQDAGDTNFAGLGKKIEEICKKLEVPVIAKEVGWGISERTAKLLADCGVSAIDVAGAGGTSWSQVEMHRAPDEFTRRTRRDLRRLGHSNRRIHFECQESRARNDDLRQRRHQGRTRHRQVHRPRRNARRHGRSIPQSRGGLDEKRRSDDEVDEEADRSHDVRGGSWNVGRFEGWEVGKGRQVNKETGRHMLGWFSGYLNLSTKCTSSVPIHFLYTCLAVPAKSFLQAAVKTLAPEVICVANHAVCVGSTYDLGRI